MLIVIDWYFAFLWIFKKCIGESFNIYKYLINICITTFRIIYPVDSNKANRPFDHIFHTFFLKLIFYSSAEGIHHYKNVHLMNDNILNNSKFEKFRYRIKYELDVD